MVQLSFLSTSGNLDNIFFLVIRAGLVWAKLSQTSQSLRITRATVRTFEKEQWEALEKRLLSWKSGLQGVLEVIGTAKRQAGQPQNVA
jgi:translation initiation factor 3 subunit M